jgi:hypothetical protein
LVELGVLLRLPDDACLGRRRPELADPRLERLSLVAAPSSRGEADADAVVLAVGDFVGVVETMLGVDPLLLLILLDLCEALNVLSLR